jgi:hypothetical protein
MITRVQPGWFTRGCTDNEASLQHDGRVAERPLLHPTRIREVVVWGVLPLLLTTFTVLRPRGRGVHFAGDFHYAFWPAARRVLHGLSPYVNPGSEAVGHAVAFVYPAVAAVLLAPFGLIAHPLADAVFAGAELAAGLLTLRVLGVRDWRLFGLVLLCPAVFAGWTLANVSLLLGLGIAAVWRWRDRPMLVGLLAVLVISAKLFLWPLGLWLLATRRYRAFAYAAVWGVALNLFAWAILGFNELGRYSSLLSALTRHEEHRGYSVIALALRAGADRQAAYGLAIGLAAVTATACLAAGRRGRETAALALAIATAVLATPIVQLHYFALLIVPLALLRPRLAAVWSLPLLMWVSASDTPRLWQVASALVLAAMMVAFAVRANPTTTTFIRQRRLESEGSSSSATNIGAVTG